MDKDRVIELSHLMPDTKSVGHLSDAHSRKVGFWLYEPAIGKLIANHFAAKDEELPACVHEEWIQRAYMHACGMLDPVVAECDAIMLANKQTIVAAMQAGLLAKDGGGLENTAKRLGVSQDVVACYEQLYFNVTDRLEETGYIASIIYPHGRLEETEGDYYCVNNTHRIALRAAYNNSYDYALYLLGMASAPIVADPARMFEATLMREGAIAAITGAVHGDNRAITHAKGLLAAAKQGGNDTAGSADEAGPAAIGATIVDALMVHKQVHFPDKKPGAVIDIDTVPINDTVKENT